MSEYEHGSEELSKNQRHYYIPYSISTEAGKALFTKMNHQHGSAVWGAVGEGIAAVEAELQTTSTHDLFQDGQEDLYEWAKLTVIEWQSMQLVNDSQLLWLKELLHEMEKRTYFELKGENK